MSGCRILQKRCKNNVPLFLRGTWLHKIQFAPFGETAKTKKKKSIEWQTPEIEGSIMVVDGYAEGAYEETVRFCN